jgi:hypothetical protein
MHFSIQRPGITARTSLMVGSFSDTRIGDAGNGPSGPGELVEGGGSPLRLSVWQGFRLACGISRKLMACSESVRSQTGIPCVRSRTPVVARANALSL